MRIHSTLRQRLLLSAALLATTPAFAQSGPEVQVAAADPQSAAAEQTAAADVTTGRGPILEEIIVTATKRETDLQQTPIAISVVNSVDLADRHVQSLLDLADGSVPGLRVATFEARQTALTIGIRGIVPLDANQPAREQGVGVYIDGVYLGRQHGLNAAMLDIARVEVLKGPQGTLFGRNTEGGALSMVTKAPTGEFGVRATAGVGNYGAYNTEAHIDLPRFGALAVKLDGALQYQRPTTKNPLAGQIGWNYFNRRGGRAAFLLEPTDNFKAEYSFDGGLDSNAPFYSQLLNYNPNNLVVGPASGALPAGQIRPLPPIVKVEGVNRMATADIGVPQQPSVDTTQGHAVHLTWSAAPELELRSISAYRRVTADQWDNSGGAHRVPQFVAGAAFSRYSVSQLKQHQYSQEFQAVGSISQFDYVAGLFYFDEYAKEEAATPNSNTWNTAGTGYTINDPTPTLPGNRSIDRGSEAFAKSYAAYGQATYTPDIWQNTLHITAGGRYTNDDKHGTLYKVNNAASNLAFTAKTDRFNPMVTVAVDATPDINLYAKYATGYRAGGASSRSLTHRSFGPEDVDSYEIGAKTELFDRRLRLNVAGYMMDRTGSQIDFSLVTPQPNGTNRNTVETINAPGVTKIRGLELDATLRVTDDLSLSGNYAYTYTKIPPTLNPFNNIVQPVFIVFTPRNAASGAVDFVRPMDSFTFRAHVDANYAQSTQTFDQTSVTNDASFIVNGRVALADIDTGRDGAALTFGLWVRNMFNEAHVYRRDPANRAALGDYGNFNAPRTFGAEVSIKY